MFKGASVLSLAPWDCFESKLLPTEPNFEVLYALLSTVESGLFKKLFVVALKSGFFPTGWVRFKFFFERIGLVSSIF